jgi:carbonic anhydrase
MLSDDIEKLLSEQEKWVLRRQLGIPTNKRLFVLTCMDERLPVNDMLGIEVGDAHIFRNAGGIVTDDAIRSALKSTLLNGTKEIIIINHTECGMMGTTGEYITEQLQARGIDIEKTPLNPAVPELQLKDPKKDFSKWLQLFTDIDDACKKQVGLMRSSPFIPQDVAIHGYIWEIESMQLRRPNQRISEKVNTAKEMHAATHKLCKHCGCLHEVDMPCSCLKPS